ncbi:hypothetical protein [Flavobacterium notoginsengisoli]|uniref:hypothetical protein n=1 Tax=Flavobacterium notoginsengisoli TaxID=1478199 RepID=UPI003643D218
MSKKNQVTTNNRNVKKNATGQTDQKSLDNRANQLNPNNIQYCKSYAKSCTKTNYKNQDDCDWKEDTFGDDWEFNHD